MKNKHWLERQLKRIYNEFGYEAGELIRFLHHNQQMPLCSIADVLGVSEWSIRKWCKKFDIETKRDGYIKLETKGKIFHRVLLLGYSDVSSAISEMRTNGKRWVDIQEILGCSQSSISRYITVDSKGFHNISPEGREAHCRNAQLLNERMERGEVKRGGFAVYRLEFSK